MGHKAGFFNRIQGDSETNHWLVGFESIPKSESLSPSNDRHHSLQHVQSPLNFSACRIRMLLAQPISLDRQMFGRVDFDSLL